MKKFDCTVNCGVSSPKLQNFLKKICAVLNQAADYHVDVLNHVTKIFAVMTDNLFINFLAVLDELNLFAKVKKIPA